MKHKKEVWNAPRKVVVCYNRKWAKGKRSFNSLAECEEYLRGLFGKDTEIEAVDEEVEDAIYLEVYTVLCGNRAHCANVKIGQ